MDRIRKIIQEVLSEEKKKRDRCLRIADRKYKKPSAYKSGAVIRCRKGDIWKDLKEENFSSINYKKIEFGPGLGDKMFDYYYPDLSSIGATQDQMDNTYIATNKKRHLHIQLDSSLQGKGLASEIIKAFIYREGYRVIPKGRIINPDMIKVLEKINQDPKFSVTDDGDEYIIDEKYSFNEQKIIEDESLHKWFKRSGTPGKEGGWVDCNAPIRKDGKIVGYKPCGRKKGEKRSKYPSCRPTAAQCKTPGKGTKWGKTK